ncbi:MAG: hypothetical protein AAF629_27585 [Chloroflexota bacterium]
MDFQPEADNPLPPPPDISIPPPKPSVHARLLPFYMLTAFLGTLAIGAIAGFVARPYILPDATKLVKIVVTPAASTGQTAAQVDESTDTTDQSAASNTDTTDQSAASNTDAEPEPAQADAANDGASPTPSIMDFLLADARHSIGAEDAPVVIIEFSDFK